MKVKFAAAVFFGSERFSHNKVQQIEDIFYLLHLFCCTVHCGLSGREMQRSRSSG